MTKKIAIINVATQNLDPALVNLIVILLRFVYEVYVSDNVRAFLHDDLRLKVFTIPDYKKRDDGGDLLKVNVAILDPEMDFLIYDPEKNSNIISTRTVLEAFLENNNTSIIVDVADYEWFIKKLTNVHSVRVKDKTWLRLKAAAMFKMKTSIIVDLVNSARPREPKSMASH